MPPPGMPRPDRGHRHGADRVAHAALDRGGRAEPGPAAAAPPQPRRVRQRDSRSARARRRRQVAAAGRRFGVRLRQHRRPARGLAVAARALSLRRPIASARWPSATRPRRRRPTPIYTRGDQSQSQHLDGLPLGTVGGIGVPHTFPLDGEYEFQVALLRTNLDAIRGLEHPHQLEIAVDGERVFLGDSRRRRRGRADWHHHRRARDATDARLHVRVPVKAGPRAGHGGLHPQDRPRTRTGCGRSCAATPAPTTPPAGRTSKSLTIAGPFNADRARAIRRAAARIFVCRPARRCRRGTPARGGFVTTLARRAYRRPVTDSDLAPLLAFYRDGPHARAASTPASSSRCARLLASPTFVFRVEDDPAAVAAGHGRIRVSDIELASRLSFFLWSSMPDDELLDAGGPAASCSKPAVLERAGAAHAADPKRRTRSSRISPGSGCTSATCSNVVAEHRRVPGLRRQPAAGASGARPSCFFDSIVREDRSVLDLLTADYTFVNERLAQALRHPERLRQPVPPRHADRRGARGACSARAASCW